MYTMDQTTHLEHRAVEQRLRWHVRRTMHVGSASALVARATQDDDDSNPTHPFLD